MADEIKVEGLKQLEATLKQLPARLGEKVMRGALRASAQVIRKDAQSKAPILKEPKKGRKPGTVKNAITVRRSKKDKFGVYVGIKGIGKKAVKEFKASGGKARENPDDPFYWIFLEFGTAKMPAAPMLRPAFEARKLEALSKFEAFAKRRVVKEANKLAQENGGNRT